MQDSNYVILVDENGQPYIAHSIFGRLKSGAGKAASAAKNASGKVSTGVGRGVRTAHKYLLKVGEGAKAKYAYTKEEVDALMGRGRRAVGEAIEKGRTTASSVAKRGRDTLSVAGTKARSAVERGKDVAGYDERERRDQAREKLGGKVDTSTPEGRQAWQDFEKAQHEYMNTPLGRLEYAKEQAKEIMSATTRTAKETASAASDKAKEFGSDLKTRSERMREEFRDKASEAADKAKETVGKVGDKASDVADRAKETASSLKDKASDVADRAKETASSLKDKASDVADRAKETASSLKDKAEEKLRDAAGFDELERLNDAKTARDEMYNRGLELAAEREPMYQAYHDFDNEMFEKYGANYKERMNESERAKYEKLDSDLSEISDQWWNALMIQMYPATYGHDQTLTDKLNQAEAEFRNTPLGKLYELRMRK